MIGYCNPIKVGEYIFSIDNIVLDCWITNADDKDVIEERIDSMVGDDNIEIIAWESGKPGTFRKQYLFKVREDRSFWLGHGLVTTGVDQNRYRMEWNPNKIGDNPCFRMVHGMLIERSRDVYTNIARFDLAIDIPVDRAKCFLVKDRRLYIERRHGVEYTQYLGAKSATVGRVKLYNKSAEAKLDYPLTRLELTLDPKMAYDEINFPKVYYSKTKSVDDSEVKIKETEKFILGAILQGYGTLNDLGRKTRVKIETLMQDYVGQVSISRKTYQKILREVTSYLQIKNN